MLKNISYPVKDSFDKTLFDVAFKVSPFIIGFVCAQKISLIGEIYIGELLAVLYLLVNLRRLDIGKPLRIFILLAFLWAFAQMLSDFHNDSEISDAVKGIGAPLIFMSTVAGLCVFLLHDMRRMPSLLLGVLFGLIPQFLFFPSMYFPGNPWKWGIGLFVIEFFAVYFTFFSRKKSSLYLIVFVFVFAIVGLFNDSRSLAIFPAFAAVLYIFLRSKRFQFVLEKFKGRLGITKLASIVIVSLLLLNTATTAVFSSEWVLSRLQAESAQKFEMQAQGGYGILFGGRSEMLVSIEAFIEKPLLGHGSWAKDNGRYQTILQSRLFQLGYSDRDDLDADSDLIPVHSYLMGSLVWAGIVGGLFWIAMIRWLLFLTITNAQQLGFYFYNGVVAMMWNIIFSPFGATARWGTAVFVASFYCYCQLISKHKIAK